MTHRKGTFKPASARSKKAALAASEDEPGELDQPARTEPLGACFCTEGCAMGEGCKRQKVTDFSHECWDE